MAESITNTEPQATRQDFALSTRGGQFAKLLTRIAITGRDGKARGVEEGLEAAFTMLDCTRSEGKSVFLVGNGGSAAVAGHIANDFVNMAGLRAITLHDTPLLTCMANDYGYENAYARILATLCRPGDMLIAISSSGNSSNITNAVAVARESDGSVLTLSGFASENRMRALGDLNIWVPIADYGMVEIAHLFILHNLADRLRLRGEANG